MLVMLTLEGIGVATDVVAGASGGLHRSAASGTELAARAAELLDTRLTPVRDAFLGWRWNAMSSTTLR
jgi:hypothetical protein